jgi:Ca2+-binding EF-hand superfamily protein
MPRTPLILTLALTLAAPALAQVDQLLAFADANGDGAVARDEVVALRLAVFARLDGDGDGILTRAEVEAAEAKAAQRRAARDPWRLDGNGDGTLSREEFTATLPGFDRADRDGDGVLSPAEIDRVKRFLGAFGAGLD